MRNDIAPDPLIARIAMGDRTAFATLYEEEGAWVYALAARFLADDQAVESAVAEAFDFFWDEVTETGHPDISTRAWLVWLTREHALEAITEGGAKPADDGWQLPKPRTPFGAAVSKLPAEASALLLRAWRAGFTDPELCGPDARPKVRGVLTLLAQNLPNTFDEDARSDAGPEMALDLLGLLDGEERERLHARLLVTPALQRARRAWAEVLSELAHAPASVSDHDAHMVPPDDMEDKVMAPVRAAGPLRRWIAQLELIPLAIGSVVAVLVAWIAIQLGALDLGGGADLQYAHLEAAPGGTVVFEAEYTPRERNLMIRPMDPAARPGTLWLRIGADEPLPLGAADPARISHIKLPKDLPDDLAGARLILRAASGETIAEGRLHGD